MTGCRAAVDLQSTEPGLMRYGAEGSDRDVLFLFASFYKQESNKIPAHQLRLLTTVIG